MSRKDPYRNRPWVATDWLLAEIDHNWSLIATCRECSHIRELGRVKNIRGAHKFKTSFELADHLRCTRCGTNRPTLSVEFVGRRRD
jgi:hypothetical protein